MSKPVLVVHHHPCPDGFSAACVIAKAFERNGVPVELFGMQYGGTKPVFSGRDIVMVDVSLSRSETIAAIAESRSFLLLDHHKTAQTELSGLESDKARFVFDMDKCGATIAWDHFFPNESPPAFLAYIEDIDLWRRRLPSALPFSTALSTLPFDRQVWTDYIDAKRSIMSLVSEGSAMRKLLESQIEKLVSKAFPVTINGVDGVAVNAPHFIASELGARLSMDHAFAAIFRVDENGLNFSLRSRNPDGADVSEICKTFGGGGHKHASGMTLSFEAGLSLLQLNRK